MASYSSRLVSPPKHAAGNNDFQAVLPDNDVQVRHLLAVFRRGKGTIVLCTLVGIVLGVSIGLLSSNKYAGTSLIELTKSSSGDPLGLQDLSGIGAELSGGEQMNSDLLTQLTVISSDTTALNVLDRLHLQDTKPFAISPDVRDGSPLGHERGLPLSDAPRHREMALQMFQTRLKVEVVKGTRLISVTYIDSDPVVAAQVANAVIDASVDVYTQARTDASSRASKWLTDQISRLRSSVEQSQRNADEYQSKNGLAGLSMSSPNRAADGTANITFSNLPLERLLELNRDLTNAEVARTEKEAIYRMTQSQDPAVVLGLGNTSLSAGSSVAQGSADIVLLQDLRQKQAAAEVRLATASSKYGAKNPAVTQLQAELASVKDQVVAEMRRIQARSFNDLQLATQTERGIRQQVAIQQDEVAKTGNVASKLIVLQQQAEADRSLYQDLHTKLEEANVVSGIRGANISVIDKAHVNLDPVSPKPVRDIEIGLISGLVLGTILAFARSFLSDLLYEPDDITSIVPEPLLGIIPDFRDTRAKTASSWRPWGTSSLEGIPSKLLITTAPLSSAAEAYRSLRTTLLQTIDGSPSRTVLFMSGTDGEGRSTTCLNTAAAFASQGYKVLVVDADMRSPQGSRYIKSDGPGLSNCLNGTVATAGCVRMFDGVPNLSVLPAGPLPQNPSELLGEKRFEEVIADLQQDFDFIFFDSPPALSVTDARVIARSVDGVVLVVRAGFTASRGFRRMVESLRLTGRIPLGVCLNAAEL